MRMCTRLNWSCNQLFHIPLSVTFTLFSEENLKSNRFRTLIDMSVKKENRAGPPQIDIESDEVKALMDLDLHANNYRDGIWGSMRHLVVKEGRVSLRIMRHLIVSFYDG